MTAAIQGFGNVGSFAARFMGELGVKVVAISGSRGAYFNGDGIDVEAAAAHRKETGGLEGLGGVEAITNEELLALDVDVLIPAALGGAIHAGNAANVKARIILEVANAPVTEGGENILADGGDVMLIPDVLASSGGVTVSYFEWVQNIQQFGWDEERVNRELGRIMARATTEVYELARAKTCLCARRPLSLRFKEWRRRSAFAVCRPSHIGGVFVVWIRDRRSRHRKILRNPQSRRWRLASGEGRGVFRDSGPERSRQDHDNQDAAWSRSS